VGYVNFNDLKIWAEEMLYSLGPRQMDEYKKKLKKYIEDLDKWEKDNAMDV